ncbi:MAG: ribonuclease P protein component [Parasporobacterium sp.]|nr:ribonuclease P protein component [Parasporobacterium sp.]
MRNINSLKNTSQFREVYENGRSSANRLLVVYVMANGTEERRLGISVSRKVGNSVIRHRITRVIRECFVRSEPHLAKGYSFIVVARVQAKEKSFSDLYDAFIHLCKKLDCYETQQKNTYSSDQVLSNVSFRA